MLLFLIREKKLNSTDDSVEWPYEIQKIVILADMQLCHCKGDYCNSNGAERIFAIRNIVGILFASLLVYWLKWSSMIDERIRAEQKPSTKTETNKLIDRGLQCTEAFSFAFS